MRNSGLTVIAMAGLALTTGCTARIARPHPAAKTAPAAPDTEDPALKAWEARMVRPCKRVAKRMVC